MGTLPPEPFCEPSAYPDASEAEHTENIEHTSSPPPPEPFPELSPSPEPKEPEPQPSTSSGITRTPAKTYEMDRSISLLSPTPLQASNSFIAPIVPWSDMALFLYDNGQRIVKVSSDGHCLMYSIMQALKLDHDIHIYHRTIANRIWKEIIERIVFYVHFNKGTHKNHIYMSNFYFCTLTLKQDKKEEEKGKAPCQKHHLFLLLILMIMDHLFLMLLKITAGNQGSKYHYVQQQNTRLLLYQMLP